MFQSGKSSLKSYMREMLKGKTFASIFLPVFLFITLTILATGWLSLAFVSRELEHLKEDHARDLNQMVLSYLKQKEQDKNVYAFLISNFPPVGESLVKDDLRGLYQALLPLKERLGIEQIYIFDNPGKPMLYLGKGTATPKISEQEVGLVRLALDGGSKSLISGDETAVSIEAVAPIKVGTGIIGAVLVKRLIDNTSLAGLTTPNDDMKLALYTRGKIMASTLSAEEQKLIEPFLAALERSAGNKSLAMPLGKGKGPGYFIWLNPIGESISLAIFSPVTDLVEARNKIALGMFIITSLFVGLFLLLAVGFTKNFVLPLDQILGVAKATIGGDLSKRANIQGNYEVAKIGQAFNNVVEQLGQRISSAEYQAERDSLTGIYNHRYFHQRLSKELDLAKKMSAPLSVVMLDIDNFKTINNSYGHMMGDGALQHVSLLLEKNLPEGSILCRYGGDEFSIILPRCNIDEAQDLANKLVKAVSEYNFSYWEKNISLTVSAGISAYPIHANTKEDLILVADHALFTAKQRGRNRALVYYTALDDLPVDPSSVEGKSIVSLNALLTAINVKDSYTYGHSLRVTQYCLEIGNALGLPPADLETLKYGAFIHDIGKLEISARILNKTSGLTPEEYKSVKEHSVFGAQVAQAIKALQPATPIILYHHERYDGQGYPEGLKDRQIPILARIVAVADSFDAMTTDRPYRQKKTLEEARQEIACCAGTQFDPEVVKAFMTIDPQRLNLIALL